MNSVKISYDGRITFWNSRLQSIQRPKVPMLLPSAEWGLFCRLSPEGKRRFLLPELGLSHVTNLDSVAEHPPKARRGVKGISSYGRSLVRMGCQRLEDEHGVKCLTFLTVTLPESLLVFCTPQTWATVVNRFLKTLRRRLRLSKLSQEVVGCCEIQEKRARVTKNIPPLHLHLVFQGRAKGKSWATRPCVYQALWEQACLSVWGGTHQFQSSCRAEGLRVSAVSYLGKYMSKGQSALQGIDPTLLPSSWYTITRSLKDYVKRAEFRASGTYACDLYYWIRDYDYLMWTREIYSSQMADGSYYLMAWIGAIKSRSKYWEIVESSRLFVKRKMEGEPLRFSQLPMSVV